MDEIVLKANRRTLLGKQVKAMRREGKLPAVIYGHHIEPNFNRDGLTRYCKEPDRTGSVGIGDG